MVMNANINSPASALENIFGYAIQAVYTGTPTGSLKLQISCDPIQNATPNPTLPTNWVDLINSSVNVSAAGAYIWNIPDVNYTWVRVVYTDGSSGASTAVLNVIINAKGV